MAALLLGCFGFMSSKFAAKRRARKESKDEYDTNFESLKEENARRVRHLSGHSMEYNNSNRSSGQSMEFNNNSTQGPFSDNNRASSQSHTQPEMLHEPPKYDDIVTERGTRHSE